MGAQANPCRDPTHTGPSRTCEDLHRLIPPPAEDFDGEATKTGNPGSEDFTVVGGARAGCSGLV